MDVLFYRYEGRYLNLWRWEAIVCPTRLPSNFKEYLAQDNIMTRGRGFPNQFRRFYYIAWQIEKRGQKVNRHNRIFESVDIFTIGGVRKIGNQITLYNVAMSPKIL